MRKAKNEIRRYTVDVSLHTASHRTLTSSTEVVSVKLTNEETVYGREHDEYKEQVRLSEGNSRIQATIGAAVNRALDSVKASNFAGAILTKESFTMRIEVVPVRVVDREQEEIDV